MFDLLQTLELLAEVAVLEEEVVRLEEQVVNFRQGLYEEAVFISSSKRNMDNQSDLHSYNSVRKYKKDQPKSSYQAESNSPTSTQFGCKASSSTNLASNLNSLKTGHCSIQPTLGKQPSRRTFPASSVVTEEEPGKEDQSCFKSSKNNKNVPKQPIQRIRTTVKSAPMENTSVEKHCIPLKLQV